MSLISKLRRRFAGPLVLLALAAPPAGAQFYQPGDVVANFALTDRATGQPVNLSDYEGKIVFLEWFAWWCPFCQAAASQTVPGVVSINAHGIPVAHVSVNLQPGQEAQTQAFIDAYRLGRVLNDFNRAIANRFAGGGQPIFAVINGVARSPNHEQWELVYSHQGYGELTSPIATFNNAINSVQAAVAPPTARPVITQPPLSATVAPGHAVNFGVTATGPGPLQYQWKLNGAAIPGATASSLALPSAATTQAGDYTVDVTNAAGTTTSRFARLVVATPEPGRIVNMSVRGPAGFNGEPLIVGFIAEGGAKSLLVRGIGPTLATYNVPGALADPTLTIFNSQTEIAANDDWGAGGAGLSGIFTQVSAFPLAAASRDAALVLAADGARTAHVRGKTTTAGIALVEVYDLEPAGPARLINVSARNQAGSGDDVLVAGFVISGNMPKTVLVRGVGPGLASYMVTGFLVDPQLEIHTTIAQSDVVVAANDDWNSEPNALTAASAVPGAFPLAMGGKDSVLLLTLPAGAYTAIVRGAGGSSGNALVEIYEVP